MFTRRDFAVVLSSIGIDWGIYASLAADAQDTIDNNAPNEFGYADFAQAWTLEQSGSLALVAAPPDIPVGFAEQYASISFSSATEINDFFKKRTDGDDFIDWFNSNLAEKGAWKGKRIVGAKVKENFNKYWDQHLVQRKCTLMEVVCYMSVFINECGGNLTYTSEKFGNASHPGISYLFDSVTLSYPATGRMWRKQSYNTGSLNKSAFVLFNDPDFNNAFSYLPPGNFLKNTDDVSWAGDRYTSGFTTKSDPGLIGYILEADFYKFRGRGLIQTTWRANYKKLVEAVTLYDGPSETVRQYGKKWKGLPLDSVLTTSKDSEWSSLFAESYILCSAVLIHARDGKYLPLTSASEKLNSDGLGSIEAFGNRIGGNGYGLRLKDRVRQVCLKLGM